MSCAHGNLEGLFFIARKRKGERSTGVLRRQGFMKNLDDRVDGPRRKLADSERGDVGFSGRSVQAFGQKGAVVFERAPAVHREMHLKLRCVGGQRHRAEHGGP